MGDPLQFDPDKVLANARQACTRDLLNRVTAFRAGMEPDALDIIEAELARRGVRREQIEAHSVQLGDVIVRADGIAARCSFCDQPAIAHGRGWHRLWKRVPVFPRWFFYCAEHQPRETRPPISENERP